MTEEFTAANDRRGSQRFRISAPLTILAGDREISAYTRDLSNRGVYFYLGSDEIASVDLDFDFMLEFPPEITLSTVCRIQCRGRAVRKETVPGNLTGVAAEILSYSILREPVDGV